MPPDSCIMQQHTTTSPTRARARDAREDAVPLQLDSCLDDFHQLAELLPRHVGAFVESTQAELTKGLQSLRTRTAWSAPCQKPTRKAGRANAKVHRATHATRTHLVAKQLGVFTRHKLAAESVHARFFHDSAALNQAGVNEALSHALDKDVDLQ